MSDLLTLTARLRSALDRTSNSHAASVSVAELRALLDAADDCNVLRAYLAALTYAARKCVETDTDGAYTLAIEGDWDRLAALKTALYIHGREGLKHEPETFAP